MTLSTLNKKIEKEFNEKFVKSYENTFVDMQGRIEVEALISSYKNDMKKVLAFILASTKKAWEEGARNGAKQVIINLAKIQAWDKNDFDKLREQLKVNTNRE